MSTTNGCGYGGKGDRPIVPPGSGPESSGGDDEEEDEHGKEGEVSPPPHSSLPEYLPWLGNLQQPRISVGTHQSK
jgi:hypothetical protein